MKLNQILNRRLNQHKLGEAATAAQVVHQANQLLKTRFQTTPTEIQALKLQGSILTIAVISSVWSQELWGYQEELLSELQNVFGKKKIQKISIRGLTTND